MIKMTMCGNVTKDAEKRVINSKECLCFTVATDAGYGENKQTTFWNVVWTTKYDSIAKGTRIYVDGIPRFKTFEKKDGSTGIDYSLFASTVEMQTSMKKETKQEESNGWSGDTFKGGNDKGGNIPF